MRDFVTAYRRELIAAAVLAALLVFYLITHPRGASTYVLTIWANQCAILGLVAIAQFFAVVVRGIDLSVGAIMALTNVVGSHLLSGTGIDLAFGVIVVVATGAACGLLNGLLVVYGRIQPIVVTLSSASIFVGLALILRPTPGGRVNYDIADAMTLDLFGIPTALVLIAIIIFAFWLPFRRTGLGLGIYAVGSSQQAAFQSGMPVATIRLAAFTLAGVFAGLAGLFYTFVTTTGDAGIAPNFTLNSIAAVVLGGVLLRGGTGTLIGALIGAFILKTIASLMFFSGIPSLAQPLFEGLILAVAIAVGAADVLRSKHRLEVFGR
ncbi:ABC transporter permease [Cognatishimia activa]|uniref:Autoinducer 2 import system permease protein LsrC n=1 Tax=Cognatishimia activa TaxID=1715691 RepID=A0A0P1IPZ8_9RHOB|nr:ABC transporter permease [Cognatishimia activa]CUI85720.1 Autoinducer 2 import system permease protein LsrD [Cognatishimia activa]CUK25562.1 Autoinducer 2 import system permease protein LsrD [Cognatishimia activa]